MDKKNSEIWFRSKWRPALGWAYILICVFDFILAPVLWTVSQSYVEIEKDTSTAIISQQWSPITLGAGGLFHLAMGGILGVTAWGRTREKISGVAGPGYPQVYFENETLTDQVQPKPQQDS